MSCSKSVEEKRNWLGSVWRRAKGSDREGWSVGAAARSEGVGRCEGVRVRGKTRAEEADKNRTVQYAPTRTHHPTP